MPTILHFEIPSDDIERSRNFYNELFGWNIEKWTGSLPATVEGMGYWLLSTVDDKGNKGLGGGMGKRQSPQQQGITNFFDVKSVQEYSPRLTIFSSRKSEVKRARLKCMCSKRSADLADSGTSRPNEEPSLII